MSKIACLTLSLIGFAVGSNEVGKAFLEENKNREGVITLPSGLQYKVLTEGTGENHPKVGTTCECHYAGTTPSLTPEAITMNEAEWTEFDSSYKRGDTTSFAPNQVITGWTEAMQLMVEGDKWEMYIPSDLGYGDSGSPPKIQGGDVLIFRMEIVNIKGESVPADKCDVESMKGCNDKQTAFVRKRQSASADQRKEELQRLEGMKGQQMKEEELNWHTSRLHLLNKLVKSDEL